MDTDGHDHANYSPNHFEYGKFANCVVRAERWHVLCTTCLPSKLILHTISKHVLDPVGCCVTCQYPFVTTLNIVGIAFVHHCDTRKSWSATTLNIISVEDCSKHLRRCIGTTAIFTHISRLRILPVVKTGDTSHMLPRLCDEGERYVHTSHVLHMPWTVGDDVINPW